jgi:hypothetical protein
MRPTSGVPSGRKGTRSSSMPGNGYVLLGSCERRSMSLLVAHCCLAVDLWCRRSSKQDPHLDRYVKLFISIRLAAHPARPQASATPRTPLPINDTRSSLSRPAPRVSRSSDRSRCSGMTTRPRAIARCCMTTLCWMKRSVWSEDGVVASRYVRAAARHVVSLLIRSSLQIIQGRLG